MKFRVIPFGVVMVADCGVALVAMEFVGGGTFSLSSLIHWADVNLTVDGTVDAIVEVTVDVTVDTSRLLFIGIFEGPWSFSGLKIALTIWLDTCFFLAFDSSIYILYISYIYLYIYPSATESDFHPPCLFKAVMSAPELTKTVDDERRNK